VLYAIDTYHLLEQFCLNMSQMLLLHRFSLPNLD
jgi:pyrroloquinoline quinone (PQQ) biosynthesis protein C